MSKSELNSVMGGTDPYHSVKDGSADLLHYYCDAEVDSVFVCETIIITVKKNKVTDIEKEKDKYADQRCASYAAGSAP